MKVQLINDRDERYSYIEQILHNRGIKDSDMKSFLSTSDDDINSWNAFGIDILKNAAIELLTTINDNKDAIIIVDADCDGYTSAALLYNYLYMINYEWVENHVKYYLHDDKSHGLNDCIDFIMERDCSLILIPDAGSNDVEECRILSNDGRKVIILDHHICEKKNDFAYIINNQNSEYPNKDFSGAGVTWQFCRFLDFLCDTHFSDELIDLAALGNCGDMMSITSIETKHVISKGFKWENIHNPFIYTIAEKNRYKLGNEITIPGAAFYIVPFVNAITRSGTLEEKKIVFKSMLLSEGKKNIPSTKRGHLFNETETVAEQAVRIAGNVKNRQKKAVDNGVALLEKQIEKNNMLNDKALIFLVEEGEIEKNVAGIVAMKFSAKYQRPACVLIHKGDTYQGSARGYKKTGILDFRDICLKTKAIMYASGHENAFGIGVKDTFIDLFRERINVLLKDASTDVVYFVDFILDKNDNLQNAFGDICELSSYWGTDFEEPEIELKNFVIPIENVSVYEKTNTTISIRINKNISIVKFYCDDKIVDDFKNLNTGCITVNMVGKAALNSYYGDGFYQLILDDYEIISSDKYYF